MSSSATNSSSDDGRTDRQPAKRAFSGEFADATEMFKESDEERAPKYAVLPTGERANRLFIVGTLTETADISKSDDSNEYWQARVVGPTGTFFAYAGQYQPEAINALRGIETPEFVAVVGKPRSYETDDGEIRVSLTPESITVVDETTREQWVVETAEQTLERIAAFKEDMSPDSDRAREAYGEEISDYMQAVMDALADVAGIELSDESDDE